MNFYPEQLRSIAALCELLNQYEDSTESKSEYAVQLSNGVPLESQQEPFGKLVDEIGGAWSWVPPTAGGAE